MTNHRSDATALTATRAGERPSVRVDAELFPADGKMVLGVRHVPIAGATGGVVICAPLLAEASRNQRREYALAELLAARGVAVQRFHYRGTGHSEGDGADVTFDSMVADAMAAQRRLAAHVGGGPIAFLGTRFGAIIAAAAAGGINGAPLVLWEPATAGESYFRRIFRAQLAGDLASGNSSGGVGALVASLREQGVVDVLGYAVDRALYESAIDLTLDGLVRGPRSILLVQLDRAPRLRNDLVEAASELEAHGCEVTKHVIVESETWGWFAGVRWRAVETLDSSWELMTRTVDWLVPRLGGTR